MTTPLPPRYIVVRAPGLINPDAYLYELDDKPTPGNSWKPDPDAPEYTRTVSGNYRIIREMAAKLNKADDKAKPTGKLKGCKFTGCRGIAEAGLAYCETHGGILRKPGHPKGSD